MNVNAHITDTTNDVNITFSLDGTVAAVQIRVGRDFLRINARQYDSIVRAHEYFVKAVQQAGSL